MHTEDEQKPRNKRTKSTCIVLARLLCTSRMHNFRKVQFQYNKINRRKENGTHSMPSFSSARTNTSDVFTVRDVASAMLGNQLPCCSNERCSYTFFRETSPTVAAELQRLLPITVVSLQRFSEAPPGWHQLEQLLACVPACLLSRVHF